MRKTYIDSKGYLRFRNSGRLLHRWVYQKLKGKLIPAGFHIHHKDKNKLNNSPKNLQAISPSDHYFKHHGRLRTKWLSRGLILAIVFVIFLIIWSKI